MFITSIIVIRFLTQNPTKLSDLGISFLKLPFLLVDEFTFIFGIIDPPSKSTYGRFFVF
jgi:hypothetical protein